MGKRWNGEKGDRKVRGEAMKGKKRLEKEVEEAGGWKKRLEGKGRGWRVRKNAGG